MNLYRFNFLKFISGIILKICGIICVLVSSNWLKLIFDTTINNDKQENYIIINKLLNNNDTTKFSNETINQVYLF